MKSFLPIKVKYCPIKKLALIPFEKKAEKIYRCFELQYLDSSIYGTGYRIIAYRNDNYLDVYDDYSLVYNKDEKFDVAENGLNKHVQTRLENVSFKSDDGKVTLSFSFTDIENRDVKFYIKEEVNKKTAPMNLLAPVGVGSKKPNFLPLFFLYDFNFIRKKHTIINCKIDNIDIEIDTFPLPMNYQKRYFTRYSEKCELIEFINTDYLKLEEVELDDNLIFVENNVSYYFESENALKEIKVKFDENETVIKFIPSLNIKEDMSGQSRIEPNSIMGYISGEYNIIKKQNLVEMNLEATEGWVSVPNSFITKILLKKNSMFCKWAKNYRLKEVINLDTKVIDGKWTNNN